MVSKFTWLSFIPATLLAVVLNVMEGMNVQLPFSSTVISYGIVLLALFVFVINFILVAIDKKISPVYLVKRNIPVAVFSLLTGTFIASKSVLTLIYMFSNYHDNDYFKYIISVVGIIAAISLVIVSLAHFQGNNYNSSVSYSLLAMPLWSCLMLIYDFKQSRILSVYEIDPLTIFVFLFAMMYFLNMSMVVSVVEGKNPVKNCFLYGFPLALICLSRGTSTIMSIITNGFDYSNNVLDLGLIALAVYIILFNIEITRNAKSVLEQEVVFDDEENSVEIPSELDYMNDNFVVAGKEEQDYQNLATADYSDFITTVVANPDDEKVATDEPVLVSPKSRYSDDGAIYVSKYFAEEFESNVINPDTEE